MKEIVLDLMCDLNQAEVNDRAQQLSSTLQRYDELEIEKKNQAKFYADQLSALGGQTRKLSLVIRQRAESRPVTCSVLYHSPHAGSKRLMRNDTGEIVRDEAMSQAELQNNLFEDRELSEEVDPTGATVLITPDHLELNATLRSLGDPEAENDQADSAEAQA